MSISKWERQLEEWCGELGFRLERSRNNHYKLLHLFSDEMLFVGTTPSDRRSQLNLLASMERIAGRRMPRDSSKKAKRRKANPIFGNGDARGERERARIKSELIQCDFDLDEIFNGTLSRSAAKRARGKLIHRANLATEAAQYGLKIEEYVPPSER